MKVNLERLKENLIELGWIGFDGDKNKELPIGDNGITRLPFTKEYFKAQQYVKNLMKNINLNIRYDAVGNMFGTLVASNSDKEIIIGSHIDTVINGGLFDGSLGVISAIESLNILKKENYSNNYNITVAVFNGEEGVKYCGYLGSRAFIGDSDLSNDEWKQLETVGIGKNEFKSASVDKEKIKNYLELHIEQGKILENKRKDIGIVKGIVGISRYNAVIKGEANHAGTTPMKLRDNALIKVSKVILEIEEMVKKINQNSENMVATIGKLDVKPGAVNVIPGEVEFTIELRDIKKENINKIIDFLKNKYPDEELKIDNYFREESVILSKNVQSAIESAAQILNYDYMHMFSGAGHDASPLAKITDAGMIFVPSKNGVSHSPKEWTNWNYVEKGANLLLETIKRLDQNL